MRIKTQQSIALILVVLAMSACSDKKKHDTRPSTVTLIERPDCPPGYGYATANPNELALAETPSQAGRKCVRLDSSVNASGTGTSVATTTSTAATKKTTATSLAAAGDATGQAPAVATLNAALNAGTTEEGVLEGNGLQIENWILLQSGEDSVFQHVNNTMVLGLGAVKDNTPPQPAGFVPGVTTGITTNINPMANIENRPLVVRVSFATATETFTSIDIAKGITACTYEQTNAPGIVWPTFCPTDSKALKAYKKPLVQIGADWFIGELNNEMLIYNAKTAKTLLRLTEAWVYMKEGADYAAAPSYLKPCGTSCPALPTSGIAAANKYEELRIGTWKIFQDAQGRLAFQSQWPKRYSLDPTGGFTAFQTGAAMTGIPGLLKFRSYGEAEMP